MAKPILIIRTTETLDTQSVRRMENKFKDYHVMLAVNPTFEIGFSVLNIADDITPVTLEELTKELSEAKSKREINEQREEAIK